MIQNLNNNLITAPELADLRKRLRNLDNRVSVSISRGFQLIDTGRTNFLCNSVSVVVSQRRGHLLVVSARSGVRAGLQSVTDIVSLADTVTFTLR